MKKELKSFVTFNRTERYGLWGLSIILLLLIIFYTTMHYWVHPAIDTAKEKELVTAWEKFKRSQDEGKPDLEQRSPNDYQDAFDENPIPLPEHVNINTADSATLVRFKGIGPKTAGKIVIRRNTKGAFTDIEQLRELYAFPDTTFKMLKQHLYVDEGK